MGQRNALEASLKSLSTSALCGERNNSILGSSGSEGLQLRKNLANQMVKAISSTSKDSENTSKGAAGVEQGKYDRNYVTERRAKEEFLLELKDLEEMRFTHRRSAIDDSQPHKVFWRKDIEDKVIERWGSMEKMILEREVREDLVEAKELPMYKKFFIDKMKEREKKRDERMSRANWPVRRLRFKESGITGDSGKVVLTAMAINLGNFGIKLGAWFYTGSSSMFSEAIHSLADTGIQAILAYGITKSESKPTKSHPYGYSNIQYVMALISGVGIFCVGAGLSVYHGIIGLLLPHSMEGIWVAMAILGVSFVSESVTLALAVRSIRQSARNQDMTFSQFVWSGWDPCVNVVLLEDLAAVLGVVTAAGCMGLSHYTGSHIPDAIGSIVIGGLLGTVAAFMIWSNTNNLVGRSIPADRIAEINRELEGDIMVRQVYDVKGIDMGNGLVRYKAEIDFDGRELARSYLERQNLKMILEESKSVENEKEMEAFLLKHGENMVDCPGAEVDRIERNLKTKHPEVRHVDLEVL